MHQRFFTEDIPEDDYDMFNHEAVNELLKKVDDLEKDKAKAKAETERDILKKQVNQLMNAHDEIRLVLIDQEETMNKMKNEAHDNSKVFELLTTEISSLNVKIKNLEDVKRDKKRRVERERLLAQEATERRKSVVVDVVGSSSQHEAGGSLSQEDIEMVDVENVQEQDVEAGQDFMLVDEDDKKDDKPDDKDDKGDDDSDQGTSRLLIGNPNVEETEELMNDEIKEQEDDSQNEASSFGKQHADQVFLSNPTIIYLNAQQEGEIEIQRTRAEM
ncbi:hypothetical protein Hanom_Chr14g01265581 [Helianthus anomalus]